MLVRALSDLIAAFGVRIRRALHGEEITALNIAIVLDLIRLIFVAKPILLPKDVISLDFLSDVYLCGHLFPRIFSHADYFSDAAKFWSSWLGGAPQETVTRVSQSIKSTLQDFVQSVDVVFV